MTFINNGSPREDTTFVIRVKDALIRHHGSGGIVQALLAFRARHEMAVKANGYPSHSPGIVLQPRGLTYPEFVAFLRSQGVELREFEAQYLCQAFDDDDTGYISPQTFMRHLLGMTVRRMSAVNKAWDKLCAMYAQDAKDQEGNIVWEGEWGKALPECAIIHPYYLPHGQTAIPGQCPATSLPNSCTYCSCCPGGAGNGSIGASHSMTTSIPSVLPAVTRLGEDIQSIFCNSNIRSYRQLANVSPNLISYEEFVAYAAALSRRVRTDEDFQKLMLRMWNADDNRAPLLNETDRDWGDDCDPLAIYAPLYVKDCLRLRDCNNPHYYFHQQRQWRNGVIFPQLNRSSIMQSTQHRDFKPYQTPEELDLADPFCTRRGQLF